MRRGLALAVAFAVAGTLVVAGLAQPAAAVSPDVVISQVYGGGGNAGATLTHDFVELYNRSDAPVALSGWTVQYASAAGAFGTVAPTPLSGTIAAGGYYLVQEAQGTGGTTPLPTPDATGTIAMSATAGKIRVVDTAAAVRDLVGYGATASQFEGTGPAPTLSNTTAALRADNGATDTDNNAADFVSGTPNPRNSGFEPPPPPPTGCDIPATHQVAAVQGPGDVTPVAGQTVRVEGVVTGDFQAAGQLGGFYLQDDTPDGDPATSDGLFAFTTAPVAVGDRVLVTGSAIEFNGLTELSPVPVVDICGTGTVAPAAVDLPRPVGVTFEPLENVLVTFPETLTASEHFQLGRFGEVTVSSDGRLFNPTDGHGDTAELNARRRILIDDGSTVQNPSTIPFTSPDVLRLGDTTSGVTGVMSFGFSLYRIQPTAPIAFARTNPRPGAPAPVGGDVKVASFNTLNYFTTIDDGSNDARGADSALELQRQQAKEVAAITGLDADILGLMEVENNGATAISTLVDALNAATAPGTYAYITEPVLNPPNSFGGTFGTDAIKVAMIYKPAAVAPVGPPQSSADPIHNRPPLIQTFQRVGGSEPVTVIGNHFKSKSCDPTSDPADFDLGQGCFNATRVAQATALIGTINTLGVPNPLVVGDLNAYTEEDPIHTLEAAGYTGLSELFVPDDDRYSFVFDGQSGELDHAMAGAGLLDNVTGTTVWHINADEPIILDYNTEFNPPGFYQPDHFRTSDHDPLLVGLQLSQAPAAPAVSVVPGWGAATVSWTAPADGGSPITGYEVRALVNGAVVRSATVGPSVRSHTFGGLTNGTTYTFVVVATNTVGTGPAGSATGKPFVPNRYTRLDVRAACPSFTVKNVNAFPFSFEWYTTRRASGSSVVAANSTVNLGGTLAPRGATGIAVVIGFRPQDATIAFC